MHCDIISVVFLQCLAFIYIILLWLKSFYPNNTTISRHSPLWPPHGYLDMLEGSEGKEFLLQNGCRASSQQCSLSLCLWLWVRVIDWSHYIGGESPYLANPGVNVAAAWQIAALHPQNLPLMSSPAPDPHYKLLQNACMTQVSLISKFKSSASIKGVWKRKALIIRQHNNIKSIFDNEVLFIPVL